MGQACALPLGIRTPAALWAALAQGVDAIEPIPLDRFDIEQWYNPDPACPGTVYVQHGAFCQDLECFDFAHFRLGAAEASAMVPEQRLAMEVACEALHDAAGGAERPERRCGVFLGGNAYYRGIYPTLPAETTYTDAGTSLAIVANRIAFTFGLTGPSLALDTACSASLVAVHLAIRSLQAGDCDMALAGGVNLLHAISGWTWLARTRALAPDGRCKTFDAAADGYARGEGCAAVVLRHWCDLSEAETAETMGCSVGTVKSTTSRGLAGLRAALDASSAIHSKEL